MMETACGLLRQLCYHISFTVVDIQGMNVTFTGMLQGEELSQAYASADIFITPSESETLGFIVLEA